MSDAFIINRRRVSNVNGVSGAVQIGGVNLIPGSMDFSGCSAPVNISGSYAGLSVFANRNDSESGYAEGAIWDVDDVVKDGDTYILSFWAKGTSMTVYLAPGYVDETVTSQGLKSDKSDGTATINLSDQWDRYWVKWHLLIKLSNLHIIVGRLIEANSADICGVMLQRGNVALDWTPAPEDIPAMAPVQSVNDQTGDIVYSNANLVLNSGVLTTNNAYNTASYLLKEALQPGTEYTIVIRADLGEDRVLLGAYASYGHIYLTTFKPTESIDGIFKKTFLMPAPPSEEYSLNVFGLYVFPNGNVSNSTIHWVKIIKGNATSDDWSPAPEDILSRLAALEAKLGITADHATQEGPSMEEDMDMDDMRQAGGYRDLYIVTLLPALIGGVRHG